MLIQSLDYRIVEKFLKNYEALIVIHGISDDAIFFAETFVNSQGNFDRVIFNPCQDLRRERPDRRGFDTSIELWQHIDDVTLPSKEHILQICYAYSREPEEVKECRITWHPRRERERGKQRGKQRGQSTWQGTWKVDRMTRWMTRRITRGLHVRCHVAILSR